MSRTRSRWMGVEGRKFSRTSFAQKSKLLENLPHPHHQLHPKTQAVATLYTFLLAHAARAYSAGSAASSCAFSLPFFLDALDFGAPSASFLKRPAASSESVQYTSGTHGCVPL